MDLISDAWTVARYLVVAPVALLPLTVFVDVAVLRRWTITTAMLRGYLQLVAVIARVLWNWVIVPALHSLRATPRAIGRWRRRR